MPINKKTKVSKGYAFIVVPLHISEKLIKPNGINYFGEKLKDESNSQENSIAIKHHYFKISHQLQHKVNRHPERELQKEKTWSWYSI